MKRRIEVTIKLTEDRSFTVALRASDYDWERALDHFEDAASEERWKRMTDDAIQREIQNYIDGLTPSLDDFLGDDDPEYDWVVPDMLAPGETLLLVGAPGAGKSTLIRQWLVQASCGIHPLTGEDIEPQRVLLVDVQDDRDHLKNELKKLRRIAGDRFNREMFHVLSGNGAGMNLLDRKDRDELSKRISDTGADMVGIGPLYNMFEGSDSDDITAKRVTEYFDEACAYSALLIEHHTPHTTSAGKAIERPIGSTHWMRWPEFGLHLGGDGSLRHWRGPRDASREWPAKLKRGGEWPWTAVSKERSEDLRWREIYAWSVNVLKRKPTTDEVAEQFGYARSTAGRIMQAHKADWADL